MGRFVDRRLRRKLGYDANNPKYVFTEPRHRLPEAQGRGSNGVVTTDDQGSDVVHYTRESSLSEIEPGTCPWNTPYPKRRPTSM